MGITRRDFIKTTIAVGAGAAIGTSAISSWNEPKDYSMTNSINLLETALAEVNNDITIISDVDGHSQCGMSLNIEDGKIIDIRGNPLDPEGKGELTLRGKHMLGMLYAPDRLQYPVKRVGERGGRQMGENFLGRGPYYNCRYVQ